jgi:hypothetical protein
MAEIANGTEIIRVRASVFPLKLLPSDKQFSLNAFRGHRLPASRTMFSADQKESIRPGEIDWP